MIKISKISTDKKRYLSLLLLADEQESMINRYLERGDLFVMHEGARLVSVAVVTDEGNGVFELKNLAVEPAYQGKGYGRKMVSYLCEHYAPICHILMVGTGESRKTMGFYRSCGFSYSHRVPDFFLENYDHPIIEEGKQLTDMIYLKLLFR